MPGDPIGENSNAAIQNLFRIAVFIMNARVTVKIVQLAENLPIVGRHNRPNRYLLTGNVQKSALYPKLQILFINGLKTFQRGMANATR